jgi:Cu+-exporting ATPase
VVGKINEHQIAVGNTALLKDLGVSGADLEARADALRRDGASAMFVVVDGRCGGLIAVADPIKATTLAALTQLRQDGVRIVMLTGDNRITAQAVAGKLGIDDIEAEVLPEQKSAVVRRLRSEGRVVAMAGDGVNDAPALARADLGLSIGTGTDVAIEASDLTLVSGDLGAAADAIRLSRATLCTIKQNLGWAFGYNVAALPLAAAGLLNPVIASAAMAFSSVSVVTNALRLRRFSSGRAQASRRHSTSPTAGPALVSPGSTATGTR